MTSGKSRRIRAARDPEEIVRPAVEGTRNVLEAARAACVRRVVVTSSGAAVGFTDDPATAAVAAMLQGDPLFLHLCVTDVRDVAAGHVLAAQKGVNGRRYILTGDRVSPTELAALLARLGGVKPPAFRPPRFLLRFLAGRFEKKAAAEGGDAPITRAQVEDVYGRHLLYDATRARTELGATFRPAADVLRDTLRWLLFIDALKPKASARVRAALGASAAPDADWTK